jgi:hypothetical protein
MGSVGDCFDNAMCESFFATLECELLDRASFRTQVEARMAVFEFIEGWYNPHRRYSAIGYLSPLTTRRPVVKNTWYHSPSPSTGAGKLRFAATQISTVKRTLPPSRPKVAVLLRECST